MRKWTDNLVIVRVAGRRALSRRPARRMHEAYSERRKIAEAARSLAESDLDSAKGLVQESNLTCDEFIGANKRAWTDKRFRDAIALFGVDVVRSWARDNMIVIPGLEE